MSRRRPYKFSKRGAGRFVQLPEWLLASQAWQSLKPGPRALYVELKRRYNGSNNGRLFLSHRNAAAALGVHRNTVGGYFEDLIDRGFIRETQGSYLGPSGVGQAAHFALEEYDCDDGRPAPKRFMAWRENQNPRTHSQPSGTVNVTPCQNPGL